MPVNLRHIINGWKNYVVENPVVEREAKRRAAICAPCEYAGTNLLGKRVCTECGCPLAFKTRSEDAGCTHPKGEKWGRGLK